MIHQLFLNSFYNPEQLNSAQTQCICRVQAMSKERHQCRESLLHPHILLQQQFHKEFHSFLFTQTNYKCKRLHKQLLDFLTNTRQSVQKRFLSLSVQSTIHNEMCSHWGRWHFDWISVLRTRQRHMFPICTFPSPKGSLTYGSVGQKHFGFQGLHLKQSKAIRSFLLHQ